MKNIKNLRINVNNIEKNNTIETSIFFPQNFMRTKPLLQCIIKINGSLYNNKLWYVYDSKKLDGEKLFLLECTEQCELMDIAKFATFSIKYDTQYEVIKYDVNFDINSYINRNYEFFLNRNNYNNILPLGSVINIVDRNSENNIFIVKFNDSITNVHSLLSLDTYTMMDVNINFCNYYIISTSALKLNIIKNAHYAHLRLDKNNLRVLNNIDKTISNKTFTNYLFEKTYFNYLNLGSLNDFTYGLTAFESELEKLLNDYKDIEVASTDRVNSNISMNNHSEDCDLKSLFEDDEQSIDINYFFKCDNTLITPSANTVDVDILNNSIDTLFNDAEEIEDKYRDLSISFSPTTAKHIKWVDASKIENEEYNNIELIELEPIEDNKYCAIM